MKYLLHKVPRFVLVIAVLAVFGLIRVPVEERIRDGLVSANLLLPPPGQGAMEQMSQSALIGTLGGLRSLVATYLVLEAFEHFSTKDWEALLRTYNIVTNLEPRDESHWVSVIWHVGINATANMELDTSLPQFERERRFQEYAWKAVELGERGLEQLPESAAIRQQLAEVYRVKLQDPCAVAELYGEMIGLEGTPPYARRFHAYFLARCPGKEREAYAYLMDLYREGERQHLPTLIKEIKNMEEKLDVPPSERIPEADPDERRPSRAPSGNVLPGGIVVP
ncbi:MAG: hypothetical protein WD342_08500 [Verrucomicrobiales bacterium]